MRYADECSNTFDVEPLDHQASGAVYDHLGWSFCLGGAYVPHPVFLITVFAKNERSDLTQAERNNLGKVVESIRDTYGRPT